MNYLMESTACIAIFYGLYLLIFRRFTFVRLNRVYLLLSLIVGLIFPLISYEVEEIVKVPINQVVYSERNFQPVMVNSSNASIVNEPVENVIDWNFMIEIIYVLGIVLMAFRFLIMIYKLLKIKRISVSSDYISTQSRFANSSFFNMVFIDDANLTENEIQQILAHEKWHIKLFHSYDLLFVEILKMLFWFNPILWLYQRSLSEVHEYEVDTRMIQAYNPQLYAQLLLKLATSTPTLATTHHFSRKPLTDRIHFIFTKQKSVPMKRLAYLSILPILGVLFMAFSLEKVVKYQEIEDSSKYFKIVRGNEINISESDMSKLAIMRLMDDEIQLLVGFDKLTNESMEEAKSYFKDYGFSLDVIDYQLNNKNILSNIEFSLLEDNKTEKEKNRSRNYEMYNDGGKFDLEEYRKLSKEDKGLFLVLNANRKTGVHSVNLGHIPPTPPASPRPPLAPKAPKHPVAPPVPPKMMGARNINAMGLIVDSETLLPVKEVELYDESNRFLGTTNVNGYFNVEVNVEKAGEIYFKLIAKKNGYDTFVQREHWGNFEENLDATYYFGLKKNRNDDSKAFSKLVLAKTYKSYNEVKDRFAVVKSEINFDKKVENAKRGNNRIFLKIDNTYYLINESGWIKINSENDKIIVNKERVFSAKELNAYVKRSCVRGMSPIQSPNASFEIYTDCLLQESPKPPVKVGFLNKMSRDSIKLIGEGQLGKNPLVIINGKQYSSHVLYKINTDKISNTATYQKEAVMKKFGVDNADGAIEINTFNRSDENLFLSKKQSVIAFENEKKRNQARLSGNSLTRVTLKDFNGKEKDELIVYKNGQHRASVTVSKGAEVLFMVGNVVKSEEEMKYIEPQLLGNNYFASQDKKEINKLGVKVDNKQIEAVMKFNY